MVVISEEPSSLSPIVVPRSYFKIGSSPRSSYLVPRPFQSPFEYFRENVIFVGIKQTIMAKILYPVNVQSFRKIREYGYVYVDKTDYIHKLANPGGFFFLSRPRRFGKSLLISTMEAYFRGERVLFRGLAIDSLEPDEWQKYPVLHLDFSQRGYNRPEDLVKTLSETLDRWEAEYDLPHPDDSPDGRLNRLIWSIYRQTGRKVVILIDEYDSPIVDAHDNHELEATNRKTLHDFYRVMKANDEYLKFVFLTGVGKIGQLNVFSGLNNLTDISLNPDYSAICGITTQELLDNLSEGIGALGAEMDLTFDETCQKLKLQYDGYHFSRKLIDVYNPYSLINALYDKSIRDYWFQSGTPTRLIKQFLKNDWGKPDLEGTLIPVSDLDSGDVLGNNLALACYYTGYLTIKDYVQRRESYVLGYPNREVRNGFFKNMLETVRKWDSIRANNFVNSLRDFIDDGDIDGFLRELQSFLAGIPYMEHTNKESQWQKDLLIIARLVGMNVDVERRTSDGRIDMVLDGPKAIYLLEFKYDDSTPEAALAQINEKNYALPFENSLNPKPIVKVGVNISPTTRNIDAWTIQR